MENEQGPEDGWRAEARPCPACDSARQNRLGRRGGAAHHASKGVEATIVRCGRCGLLYANPTLLPRGNPYAAHSSGEYFHGHQTERKRAAGRALAETAARLLGRTGRLLELGCGRGELLEGAREAGWQVQGVEMTPGFAERATGVSIEVASIEDAQCLAARYDVVFLAAILEHLYEPRACLESVCGALNPGGVVFIDVPNESSLWNAVGNVYMRLRGRDGVTNLSPTFPPYHVVGFSPKSLITLLSKTGFEIVEIKTHRWQNDLPAPTSLGERLERHGLEGALSVGQWLGMGAGITCWARKVGN